jgi:1,4-dihydroxy-2-naphthoate octaprenyltransferase
VLGFASGLITYKMLNQNQLELSKQEMLYSSLSAGGIGLFAFKNWTTRALGMLTFVGGVTYATKSFWKPLLNSLAVKH